MEHSKEYLEFIKKFEVKKTTDDCYTPPKVYDAVLDYVKENCDIEGLKVVRPFYPGGDYQSENYKGCVVVDNPPFSIISKIIRFYNERNIKYFLFAPHLTLFSTNQDYTGIVVGVTVTYENGAKVNTSFVSNLFGDIKILGEPKLYQRLKELEENNKAPLPKYVYPENVITVAGISKIVMRGESIKIKKEEVSWCSGLDGQKRLKKTIFGHGFLVSDKVAEERITKERTAGENEAKKKAKVWQLSERERNIIKQLG